LGDATPGKPGKNQGGSVTYLILKGKRLPNFWAAAMAIQESESGKKLVPAV
jgi:hypothetical protein